MVEISSLPDKLLSTTYAEAERLAKEPLTNTILHQSRAISQLGTTVEEMVFNPIPSDLATLLNEFPPQAAMSMSPPKGSPASNLFSPAIWDHFVNTMQPLLTGKEKKQKKTKNPDEEQTKIQDFFQHVQDLQRMIQEADNRRNQFTKS
jgi:hypothetical protein